MTSDTTLQQSHQEHPPHRQQSSPLAIPELLDLIFSFLESSDIAHSVIPVCWQWFLMSRHRLVKVVTWNSQLSKKELQRDLSKFQEAGRLRCFISKDGAALDLWDDLVGAVKERHARRQTRSDVKLLQRDSSLANSATHTNPALYNPFRVKRCVESGGPMFVNRVGKLEEFVSHRSPLRIQSLALLNVQLHRSALESLLSISPHLKELRLHTWKGNGIKKPAVFGSNNFNEVEKARLDAFWTQHSTIDKYNISELLQEIGDGSTLMFLNSTLSVALIQALHTTQNVVTTLELCRDVCNTAVGLQEYLCNSPHLLHLLAPNTELSVHNIDIHLRLTHIWMRVVSQTWACRNLLTLHLAFHSYGSGRIESPIVSRIIFGYISKMCPQVRDLELNGLVDHSLQNREHKPILCMRLEGGLCYLARLKNLRRLRVGSFDAKLQSTPSDLQWMVASGHTTKARKARRRVIAEWDFSLAKEQQEELDRLSNPNRSTSIDSARASVAVDTGMVSQLKNHGLLGDLKTMLLEEMESSDFDLWPWLTNVGFYHDADFLSTADREYHRLTKDYVLVHRNRLSQMFSF
ncbi:MAG: hypothetical protein J3R72DRAFT_512720 [Linnemannia gamsii]|nr:MAG: hypothetical protein J3R72DRAFT_512720 [Linnemannia gamsii]